MAGISGSSKNNVGEMSKCSTPSLRYKRVPEMLPLSEKNIDPVIPGIFNKMEEVLILVTGLNVNPAREAFPFGVMICISPEVPLPTVAVIVELSTTVNEEAGVPPKVTAEVLLKFFPFIMISVLGDPEVGLKEVIEGAVFSTGVGAGSIVCFWQAIKMKYEQRDRMK